MPARTRACRDGRGVRGRASTLDSCCLLKVYQCLLFSFSKICACQKNSNVYDFPFSKTLGNDVPNAFFFFVRPPLLLVFCRHFEAKTSPRSHALAAEPRRAGRDAGRTQRAKSPGTCEASPVWWALGKAGQQCL